MSLCLSSDAASMKTIALLMLISGAAVATGAALEFAYFGPWTPQFIAGLIGTPAGLLGIAGGISLWRHRQASRHTGWCAGSLLAGTVACTALDVMGPPATVLGLLGSLPALFWAWRSYRSKNGGGAIPNDRRYT